VTRPAAPTPTTIPPTAHAAPAGDNGVLDGLLHLGDRLIDTLTDTAGAIVNGIAGALAPFLGWIGDTVWAAGQAIIAALSPLLQRVGDLLTSALSLLAGVVDAIVGLPEAIWSTAVGYLVPSPAELASVKTEASGRLSSTPPGAAIASATGLVGVFLAKVNGGLASPSCGPVIGFDGAGSVGGAAAMPGFHLRLPSPAPCAGNGPGGSRTSYDNDAADLLGYRQLVRGLLLFGLVAAVLQSFISAAPWANKANTLGPGSDSGDVVGGSGGRRLSPGRTTRAQTGGAG